MVVGQGVHLLGVEPDRAGKREEIAKQPVCFLCSSAAGETFDEPERARKERPLLPGKAVVSGWIAVEQRSAGAEIAADGVKGCADARRVGRLEVQLGQDQVRGGDPADLGLLG